MEAVLLVIDVQKGLFNRPIPIYHAEMLLENINRLIEYARINDIPVCFVQHANKSMLVEETDDWQLHPGLHLAEPVWRITKRHGSAFQDTSLEGELQKRNIRTVLVTGLVTHGCVKSTCEDARKRGFEVVLVSDGHSNYHRQAPEVIAEWNQKLSDDGTVKLLPTGEVISKGLEDMDSK